MAADKGKRRMQQLGWFVLLYGAGVVVVTLLAYALRTWIMSFS